MDNKTLNKIGDLLDGKRTRTTFINDSRKRTTLEIIAGELHYSILNGGVPGTTTMVISRDEANRAYQKFTDRRDEVLEFLECAFNVELSHGQIKGYSGNTFTIEFQYAGTIQEVLEQFTNVQRVVHVVGSSSNAVGRQVFTVKSDGQTLTMDKVGRVLRIQI